MTDRTISPLCRRMIEGHDGPRLRASDVLRRVFESAVRGCMAAGLVGGEGFAVDASVIEVDASRFKRVEGPEIDWTDAQRARRPTRTGH